MTASAALSSLGAFALVLASMFVVPFALWCNFSLARTAQLDARVSAPWLWILAFVVTLGLPVALSVWKYGTDGRRLSAAMMWLPLLWNLGAILLCTQVIPGLLVQSLRAQGDLAGTRFGDSHKVARILSAVGNGLADRLAPPAAPRAAARASESAPTPVTLAPGAAPNTAIAVPFSAAGNAILMNVQLEGPGGRLDLPYLFDTGASFTTVHTETAAKLGLKVPADAPTLQFNTASGPRESRMVYLPVLRLGGIELNGLLVSVCDGCANDRSQGLLGLNVMREFLVEMDYQAERMKLLPRPHDGRANRAYDIYPAVQIEVEGSPEIWLGRIRWILLVKNRSTVAIENVLPEVHFSDGQRMAGARIARIEPGGSGRSLVEGKTVAEDHEKLGFTLALAEAYW
ncbi:retropepsin-like aspartic protease family protein [Nannocystis bainbridge]|uniref:Retropepsin-like aspartic protease n=1 Tax=Nannocystis bainbridge TaxID=2995303 RepID=A0ABT5E087_9BACT|nr:retropepsin-like aspartic protease [Nannocystis bainbridge]MDC0718734.1 retropepsin-like aspartic protease [Nannocystis bainbridge]MDC0722610.1 retropepsin-like aspartic protease [Nannocystis bainbridge]